MKKIKPVFIGLYDSKLLGIRYLSATLRKNDYDSHIIFLKSFTSHHTQEPTSWEYDALFNKVEDLDPDVICISVMCSFYEKVAQHISEEIKRRTGKLIVWGGVCPTLFPEKALRYADVVIRGEGEETIVEFMNALSEGKSYRCIQNVCYKDKEKVIINPVRSLIQDLDSIPFPDLGGDNKYYINHDKISKCDPAASSYSYELTGSRGCPNQCSYCSSSNIRRLYKGSEKYVRLRSIDNIIEEIKYARSILPNMRLIHFWDEIFPVKEEWVEAFANRYKEEINLPFEIWGHPKHIRLQNIKRLVEAGLSKVVVGIQSGSPIVRKEIYKRNESQESIIECSQILSEAKVPMVIYDFILDHPFETSQDLQETLELCMTLHKPFILQLHGLSFLPGTQIEQIAVEKGVRTWEEIRAEQNRPLAEQYRAMHWWRIGKGLSKEPEKVFWHSLIYLSQFPRGEQVINWALKKEKLRQDPKTLLHIQKGFNQYLLYKMGARKLQFMVGMKKQQSRS